MPRQWGLQRWGRAGTGPWSVVAFIVVLVVLVVVAAAVVVAVAVAVDVAVVAPSADGRPL